MTIKINTYKNMEEAWRDAERAIAEDWMYETVEINGSSYERNYDPATGKTMMRQYELASDEMKGYVQFYEDGSVMIYEVA